MPSGRKKPAPQPLSLYDPSKATAQNHSRDYYNVSTDPDATSSTASGLSPIDSRSPNSGGTSPSFRSKFATKKRPQTAKSGSNNPEFDPHNDYHRPSHPSLDPLNQPEAPPFSPINSVLDQPKGPPLRQPTHESKKSKSGGLFHFSKSSRTHNQLPTHPPPPQQQPNPRYQANQIAPSEPNFASGSGGFPPEHSDNQALRESPSNFSLSSAGDREANPAAFASASSTGRKSNKQKPFGILSRTKSLRDKDANGARSIPDQMPSGARDYSPRGDSPPLPTSPEQSERAFRDETDASLRARSEDRSFVGRDDSRSRERPREERGRGTPPPNRDHGSTFLSGLRSSSTRAAMFSKGFFGKGGRSGGNDKGYGGVDDEHYELKVINLPLVEQTRRTRISKRLEDSRDKTEFWMPAFPWRAIDYLNYKGCEVEGLYRVPGSGPQIKRWQRRFDENYDVNLFEAKDLYDINIIGSMLKAWLRELPDELFPKAAQERIARECAGAETVPQLLIDELSNLSPFQYYLLFAITCHLSLLLAHSDKNKMDFRNLCICFQPCMKIDAFCFKFLVCDWRECWKGCKNEAAYIEQEYILLDQPPPITVTEHGQSPNLENVQDEPRPREEQQSHVSSRSNSTAPSYHNLDDHQAFEPTRQPTLRETHLRGNSERGDKITSTSLALPSRGDQVQLSPIAPLSPLGFK
ncbi:unnamed protein product [Clonostachys rhizophaga]|uniref:Rho-GAP domain-containing protein n=1 Tax=Clonostachys rhizophaga TaxID=160324 RepID=A0A9N9VRQ6_9HYPO|nr:unnamed protein product [Clonostachys rhizophaga]